MPTITDIYSDISQYQQSILKKVSSAQLDIFQKVDKSLSQLAVNADGTIKQTASNVSILNDIKLELSLLPKNKQYQKAVADLYSSMSSVAEAQTALVGTMFDQAKPNAYTKALINNAFSESKTALIGSGLNENIINAATEIVSTGIKNNADFFEMRDQLKDFIIGSKKVDSKIISYVKQTISDSLHTTTRIINANVGEESDWFRYVGGTMDTTRPWCLAMVKKEWIHSSELAGICRGLIDGKKVSLQGLYPDTDKSNVQERCGGYNCEHQLLSIHEDYVPKKIKAKFDKK